MPEAHDEEVGRRLFQIHREKAVEVALEKIRRKMPTEWKSFTSKDIDVLKHILGEAWSASSGANGKVSLSQS
jgi:hypothetical protein